MTSTQDTEWLEKIQPEMKAYADKLIEADHPNASWEEKAIIAMNVRNGFVNAARQGIHDVKVILKLESDSPLWSYKQREKLLATDKDKPLSGEELNKKLYDQAFDIKKLKEETTYVSACFAAGTLVHTDKGLIPIQDIRVGDKVLSRDENDPNGELCYKSVLKTVKTPNQEVFRFTYCAEDQYDVIESNLSYVIATKDHPFWNNTEGRWCPTIDMSSGAEILLANQGDMEYYFLANNQIYQTCNSKGVVFGYCDNPLSETSPIQIKSIFEITSEHVISYFNPLSLETFKPNNGSSLNYEERGDIAKYAEDKALLCDVYNIEVEDYHTYFVGEEGVWVHNTNCGMEQLPYIQSHYPSHQVTQDDLSDQTLINLQQKSSTLL